MKALKKLLKKLPGIRRIVAQRDLLAMELDSLIRRGGFYPPGHFYSPIPNIDEVKKDETQICSLSREDIGGIDLNYEDQVLFLDSFVPYLKEQPFSEKKQEGLHYFFENEAYSYADALTLYGVIRRFKPKRIIEVGSGYSSCLTLDTNRLYFDNAIELTFIEPYPQLLKNLLEEEQSSQVRILEMRLQDVPIEVFDKLEANDILFIDSTHVSRVNSDVNRALFELFPKLKPGVLIHIHDVFWPFNIRASGFSKTEDGTRSTLCVRSFKTTPTIKSCSGITIWPKNICQCSPKRPRFFQRIKVARSGFGRHAKTWCINIGFAGDLNQSGLSHLEIVRSVKWRSTEGAVEANHIQHSMIS